jgi:hypothetical protein
MHWSLIFVGLVTAAGELLGRLVRADPASLEEVCRAGIGAVAGPVRGLAAAWPGTAATRRPSWES